jgi:hypothetical protein
MHSIRLKLAISDSSFFVYKKNGDKLAYLLLYIEDIVLTTSSISLLQRITTHLGSSFTLKDLKHLHFFPDIQV